MKERLKSKIKTLTEFIGVSGSEQPVMKYCRDYLKPLADEVVVLPCGDVIAKFDSGKPGPSMMLGAHADEIGFHIRAIDKNGFIFFGTYGGVQLSTILARRVLFNGSKGVVKGIVGVTPGHIVPADMKNKLPEMDNCYIDVGANSAEEVYEMGLDIGSTAVIESPMTELNHPDLITGRALDDRVGVALLLELAEKMKSGEIKYEGVIYLAVTVQEEVGLVGGLHAADYAKPDCYIAVDTAPCGGTPEVNPRRLPTLMSHGPIITIGDMTSPTSRIFPNHGLVAEIKKMAAENGINIQRNPSPGAGNNEAGGVNHMGTHCPAVGLIMPRRYSHSPAELLDMNDLIAEYTLLKGLIEKNGHLSFDFFAE